MERKVSKFEGKKKIANGFLRKQPTLNNNSLLKNLNQGAEDNKKKKPTKNLNESPKKGKSLPTKGAPPVAALPQGCTPLMYACQQADHKQVADILRKDPGSVLKRDRTLKTALHYCFDNPTAVTADRILMAAPALLEGRDQDGFTPLHLAVIQGNMPLVTFLLANNADVMALDNEKHSVVHWATVCGELEALRAVLSAGADASTADVHGGYPLHYAAQMCGARGAGGGGGSRLALDVLGALLRAPAARVDVKDGDGRQPLLWAASAGSAPAILALVKAGAEVEAADKDGLTALHCAASRGHTECLETLVTLCGARTDVIDSNGCTALHYAVTLGHADATALLLQHGADPNRQDRRGRSPAHCGCAKGQLETVKMLGAHNANLWLRNAKGDLPLHEAVASGRRELVKWLLEMRPSQINATNNDGRTLLHIAANSDNTDLCKILLDFGSQVNAVLRTSKNILMTPLDCALHRGYRSTAKYLQMHGGLPASRLSSRHVVVDQETVPQLPIRHIKSTKINLRDKVAIERREIFEMSPCSTPRRRKASKATTLSESSDYSSDEYELQSQKYREERRRHKRRAKREQSKYKTNSFSDGYDSDTRRRRSKHDKSISDSEGSGRTKEKKSKRSKSEPVPKSRSESRHRTKGTPKKNRQKRKDEGSESDNDKKYKKRRKSGSRKSVRLSSGSSEHSSIEEKEITKKKESKTKSQRVIEKAEKQQVQDMELLKQAVEVAKNIEIIENEKNKETLENIFEKQLSETETNTFSIVETTVITEAQIHAESKASLDKDSIQSSAMEENSGKSDVQETPVKAIQSIIDGGEEIKQITVEKKDAVDTTQVSTQENEQQKHTAEKTEIKSDKPEYKLEVQQPESNKVEQTKETESEIEKTKTNDDQEDTEASKTGPDKATRDGIIAIIPDSDSLDIQTDELLPDDTQNERYVMKKGDSTSVDTDEKSENIQAIISILSDEENKAITVLSEPDSLMGESVTGIDSAMEDKMPRELTLINEETESRSVKILEQQIHKSIQDSAETTAGISETTDSVTDSKETKLIKNRSKEKAVQKVLPDVKTSLKQQGKRKSQDEIQKWRSQESVKSKQILETQSYKVLTDTSTNEEVNDDKQNIKDNIDSTINEIAETEFEEPDRFVKQAGYTRRRMSSISDNEMYSIVDSSGNIRRRRLKKKYRDKSRNGSIRSKSQNSERDYESSGLIDSGFEPSPRMHQNRIMSPRLAAYYEDRNASGLYTGTVDSKIPKRKPGDRNAVDMTSVTQIVQTNMRRYFLERKIFQHLMDLKHIQIRAGKANEAVLVKRAIDDYHKSSLAYVGAGRYTSTDFTFKKFEKFLYDSLRKLQKSGVRHLANLPERAFPDFVGKDQENLYKMDGLPDNPILCTSKTHRCYHAVHAYTGIPCSAYIPMKLNHHTMPKPPTHGQKKGSSFLPHIQSKGRQSNSQVTLELCHGNEKQMIALPAEKLDKNKRYYVTFTVKGSNPDSDNENKNKQSDNAMRNVKSV